MSYGGKNALNISAVFLISIVPCLIFSSANPSSFCESTDRKKAVIFCASFNALIATVIDGVRIIIYISTIFDDSASSFSEVSADSLLK